MTCDFRNTKDFIHLTEQIVMHLFECGLQCRPAEPSLTAQVDAEVWKQVLLLSARQGVLAIAYDALQTLPAASQPPKEFMLRWAVSADRIEKEYAFKLSTLEQLTAFYASHRIPVLLLKGAGLASLYPTPEHRPCGDIDIWLYGNQPEADEKMRRELGIPIDGSVHHHTVFRFKGVMVENHFDFLNCWSHRSNRELEREMRRYAEEPGQKLRVGAQSVCLPSPNLNALFLMRHMAVHFAAVEIGLRQIADWAVFLQADGDKVDWPAIRAIYKTQHMERFADAVTAFCVKRLGVDAAKAYCYQDDERLQETILGETLHPAFGEKHPDSGLLRSALFKLRRWWANRWKHRLVYKDSLAESFLWLCWAHLIRPKTIAN